MGTISAPKKRTPKGWHPADIQAALKKRGWSFRKLSIAHGYCEGSLKAALRKPWARAERIIARTIGVEPWNIWPSRYDDEHNPLGPCRHPHALQNIKPADPINVKIRRVK